MDSLKATYKESEEDEEEEKLSDPTTTTTTSEIPESHQNSERQRQHKDTSLSPSDSPWESDPKSDNHDDDDEDEDLPPKKQKHLSSLSQPNPQNQGNANLYVENPKLQADNAIRDENNNNNSDVATPPLATTEATPTATQPKKKSKKKNSNNVWVTRSTRKGKKKVKPNSQNTPSEDTVLVTPLPRHFDKNDDAPELTICLSKVNKAEKVELSEDRLSAGSCKGYRMVRATRGVSEGAWYFEIKVVSLGETGHTRLGWSTEKGDLQAPVGYDDYSFGYRDIDGCKVHKALREKYGEEGYKEGDVIGFYINLPDGGLYTPRQPRMVWYKGQRYLCGSDSKDDMPKIVPGSEISFFKNGICQGVSFKDICGGCYYPAASMYTLPNQPNCTVKFNFGPDFEFFPEDFGGRPVPKPLVEVLYHGFDTRVENGASTEK